MYCIPVNGATPFGGFVPAIIQGSEETCETNQVSAQYLFRK